jgi:ATP-dependent protease HslVU (ClpYQ) peptidase subunit
MTIICALHDQGETWIGCDSRGVLNDIPMDNMRKWVLADGWWIGVAGHARTLDLVLHRSQDLVKDINGPHDFTRNLLDFFAEHGFSKREGDARPPSYGNWFILVRGDQIWSINECMAVTNIFDGQFWADGSGQLLAMGAAYALMTEENVSPKEVVRESMAAAVELDINCGGKLWTRKVYPITVLSS